MENKSKVAPHLEWRLKQEGLMMTMALEARGVGGAEMEHDLKLLLSSHVAHHR
jgi:hypothetical protein